MNILVPVITEKTMKLAGSGKYTFKIDPGINKYQAKKLVETAFGVKVLSVSSANKRSISKRTAKGRKVTLPREKKIVVKLSGKDKISLFEEKKK